MAASLPQGVYDCFVAADLGRRMTGGLGRSARSIPTHLPTVASRLLPVVSLSFWEGDQGHAPNGFPQQHKHQIARPQRKTLGLVDNLCAALVSYDPWHHEPTH